MVALLLIWGVVDVVTPPRAEATDSMRIAAQRIPTNGFGAAPDRASRVVSIQPGAPLESCEIRNLVVVPDHGGACNHDSDSEAAFRIASTGHNSLQALLAVASLHQQLPAETAGKHETAEESLRNSPFVLDEVLQLVAEHALKVTGAAGVAIALANDDAFRCCASAGSAIPDRAINLDPISRFSGACLVSGKIMYCVDTKVDSRVDQEACLKLGARSIVAVPLTAKQTTIGLIEAFFTEPYRFSDEGVRALSMLAELIPSTIVGKEQDRLAAVSRQILCRRGETSTGSEAETPKQVPNAENLAEKPGPTTVPSFSSQYATPGVQRPRRLVPEVVIAIILFSIALGFGIWWKMRAPDSTSAAQPYVSPLAESAHPHTQDISMLTSSQQHAAPAVKQDSGEAATVAQAALSEVTDVHYRPSADSSTVTIDLDHGVQYKAHRLTHPERIYLDLYNTRLTRKLLKRDMEVGDKIIKRVRTGEPMAGTTRLVLELADLSHFSVNLKTNPWRLVIQLRRTAR